MKAILFTVLGIACSSSPGLEALDPLKPVAVCLGSGLPTESLELAQEGWPTVYAGCSGDQVVNVWVHPLEPGWNAIADKLDYSVIIDPSVLGPDPPNPLDIVIAHELGHLFGGVHTEGDCDLMRWNGPAPGCEVIIYP